MKNKKGYLFNFVLICILLVFICSPLIKNQGLFFRNTKNPSLSSPHYLPRTQDQTEANFSLNLNKSTITRGKDDLVIYFFLSLNDSPIPGDTMIYYNISHDIHTVIAMGSLHANESTNFVEIVNKKNFYSQPSGNYTISAIANGSSIYPIIQVKVFTLKVLPSAQIQMTFDTDSEKVELERNETTPVDFEIVNVGGSTASNITISPSINREGTRETPVIYLPNLNISLGSGESYYGTITFFTDTPLFQIHTYFLSFSNIDDPDKPIYVLSDPLTLICYPNLTVSNVFFPNNATLGEPYTISYDIINHEAETIYIQNKIISAFIPFSEVNNQTQAVSPNYHFFTYESIPQQSGNTTITLEILVEWSTQSGLKWTSSIYFSGRYPIEIQAKASSFDPFDPLLTITIILISFILGIGYFSRDIVKNIVKKGKVEEEKVFPETTYPFDTVVIDGSNVAWEEKDSNANPQLANIESMINKLSRANFKKIITVADAALRYQIDNQRRLDRLVKEGAIKMLPARVDGDKFILRIAEEENAMIVSNDLFKEFREIAPWVDERRIPFTILDGEVFLHPTAEKPKETSINLSHAFEN